MFVFSRLYSALFAPSAVSSRRTRSSQKDLEVTSDVTAKMDVRVRVQRELQVLLSLS